MYISNAYLLPSDTDIQVRHGVLCFAEHPQAYPLAYLFFIILDVDSSDRGELWQLLEWVRVCSYATVSSAEELKMTSDLNLLQTLQDFLLANRFRM